MPRVERIDHAGNQSYVGRQRLPDDPVDDGGGEVEVLGSLGHLDAENLTIVAAAPSTKQKSQQERKDKGHGK